MADEPKAEETGVTAGGIRMADDRIRFEKHAILGANEATKKAFTRPWGSQPMNVDTKTGRLTGAPHPEQKLVRGKEEEKAAAKKEKPSKDVEMIPAYGR